MRHLMIAIVVCAGAMLSADAARADRVPRPRPTPTSQPATQPSPPRAAVQRVGGIAIGVGVAALVAVGGLSLLRRR